MSANIKTIANVYRELAKLIPAAYAYSMSNRDGCRASAIKRVDYRHGPYGRSQETLYFGEMYWIKPPDDQGELFVMGIGKTPAEAYRKTLEDLREKLAQRSQLFQIQAEQPAPRLQQAVKCLEYHTD